MHALPLVFALSLVSAAPANPPNPAAPPVFGPPLVCQPFEIGKAASLPWESGTKGRADYDLSRLVADTTALLLAEKDLVVRMETLRRAAIYASKDRALAWELVGRAALATYDASLGAGSEAVRCFDLGFLTAVLDQLGVEVGTRGGARDGIDGYGYLLRALDLHHHHEREAGVRADEPSAAIEFACALAAHPAMRPGGGDASDRARYWRHVDAARGAATAGTLTARNLAAHEASWKRYVER